MKKSFAIIEGALTDGQFLCGARPCMADVYLAMLQVWSPDPITSPRLVALRKAVAADSVVAPLWRRHGFER
jgi:glutathione S-transferase